VPLGRTRTGFRSGSKHRGFGETIQQHHSPQGTADGDLRSRYKPADERRQLEGQAVDGRQLRNGAAIWAAWLVDGVGRSASLTR
jgi:hypothetical protein